MLTKMCCKCKRIIAYPLRYCDQCQLIVDQENEESKQKSNKRYNQKRDAKYSKFYSSKAWKVLSARYLQDIEYKCEECGKYATEVHHIEPIQTGAGWVRRYDYSNLKALCHLCHDVKHGRFQKRKR